MAENGSCGTLESIPFTLDGDELQFCAAIPKESTMAIFCMAIYHSQPIGKDQSIQHVRSIFDREPDEILMGRTFFYLRPQDLIEENGWIRGWRVVRILQKTDVDEWVHYTWDISAWKNRQALWLAADRDMYHTMRIDHIIQTKHYPGYYWNFEDGTFQGWKTSGTAFGVDAAFSGFGDQEKISGYDGNYFINSFHDGSDVPTGSLISPEFIIPSGKLTFRIGGGSDWHRNYVELTIEGIAVARATGNRSEKLSNVEWDLSSWEGKKGQIRIVDDSGDPWGHILADDFRISAYQEP